MNLFSKSLLIFAVVLFVGCSKEKPAENAPAPAPEPPVMKKEIQTLHKAEDLQKSATDDIAEQRKQIDAATQ